MQLKIGNNVIASYKRLAYSPWYAIAEFVDNSTQAYFNNKARLDKVFQKNNETLFVGINYLPDKNTIIIEDNSIGMNHAELTNALILGRQPDFSDGRSKYGLGLKTSACWFGDLWTVRTKKLGEEFCYEVTVDVNKIAKSSTNLKLPEKKIKAKKEDHYTVIEIKKLNRQFKTNTISKIKDYLRSIYRYDFKAYGLQIYWQNERLTWEDLTDKLYILEDGKPYKKSINLKVNGKKVTGWVGVMGKGKASRKNAGFSLIQSNRVIEGWPNGFKPVSVFGDQEDGRNDLINQRVIGEIFLDGFAVSHTKDKIVWQDDELDEIDTKLGEVSKEAMDLARSLRFNKVDDQSKQSVYRDEAVDLFESELKSSEIRNYLNSVSPPSENVIKKSYLRVSNAVLDQRKPYLNIIIGTGSSKLTIQLFFNENSEFEPYVIIESTPNNNRVIIVINALHPHYLDLKKTEDILNFFRHCVYDGVAEWKAIKLTGQILPNTIRFLKDGLLRLPMEIRNNKFKAEE